MRELEVEDGKMKIGDVGVLVGVHQRRQGETSLGGWHKGRKRRKARKKPVGRPNRPSPTENAENRLERPRVFAEALRNSDNALLRGYRSNQRRLATSEESGGQERKSSNLQLSDPWRLGLADASVATVVQQHLSKIRVWN